MTAEKWDAHLYDAKHAFVWQRAKGVVELLSPQTGERILDLGCGTGALAAEVASRSRSHGVDRSTEMIDRARRKFPAIRFEVCDARKLPFVDEFNAVFSTPPYTDSRRRAGSRRNLALKNNGRFVAEFGGKGNVRLVVAALEIALGNSIFLPMKTVVLLKHHEYSHF